MTTTTKLELDAYHPRPRPAEQSATHSAPDEREATHARAGDAERGRVAFEAFHSRFCGGSALRLADLWQHESETARLEWAAAYDACAAHATAALRHQFRAAIADALYCCDDDFERDTDAEVCKRMVRAFHAEHDRRRMADDSEQAALADLKAERTRREAAEAALSTVQESLGEAIRQRGEEHTARNVAEVRLRDAERTIETLRAAHRVEGEDKAFFAKRVNEIAKECQEEHDKRVAAEKRVADLEREAEGRRDACAPLVRAIRTFTVEAPNGQPNGAHEETLQRLGDEIKNNSIRGMFKAYQDLCNALADDTRALRIAAEAAFDMSFRHPGAVALGPGLAPAASDEHDPNRSEVGAGAPDPLPEPPHDFGLVGGLSGREAAIGNAMQWLAECVRLLDERARRARPAVGGSNGNT